MSARSRGVTRRRASAVGIVMFVVAFIGADGRTIARAQGGRAPDQRPNQGTTAPGILNPYAAPSMHGSFAPYLVRDPTADERAAVAERMYRAVLDEWVRRARTSPRPGGGPPDVEARSDLELIERLGPWSLRRQEAQDNAARSRAARYQSLSDHLARMSALEQGRFRHETDQAKAAGVPAEPKPTRVSAEAARSFRPIDGWSFDRIIPRRFESGPPLNLAGVAVTAAERAEIAGRVYRAILDDAVGRYLASPREGEARRPDEAIFDAPLAERLAFWSDLWSQAQDAADQDLLSRSPAARDRTVRASPAGARSAGGRTAAIRSHVERMSDLESGRFVDDVLKRAGRPAVGPVDMARFRAFAEVARFFRIDAEGLLPGGSSSRDADTPDADQAATAGRMYRAVLDDAARRYRDAARAGGEPADVGVVFDSRLVERLAAWSIQWARAQIRVDGSRASQFTAVRSHIGRMASLEEARSLRDVLERAGQLSGGPAGPAPPREFADVARFFRLEALWELEQIKSR